MASPRWLVLPVLVTASAVGIAACSSTATPTTATASSSTTGTGGASGALGTTSSTGTGGADVDAGLVCKTHSYSTIKAGPCDLLQQNCPDSNTCKELKNANGTWTTQCVLANGLKGEGETCVVDG